MGSIAVHYALVIEYRDIYAALQVQRPIALPCSIKVSVYSKTSLRLCYAVKRILFCGIIILYKIQAFFYVKREEGLPVSFVMHEVQTSVTAVHRSLRVFYVQ